MTIMVSNINVHHTTRMSARADWHRDTTWLEVTFASDDSEFKIAAFMPQEVAHRVAAAINAAWDEPTERLRFTPPGIRGEDVLPDDPPAYVPPLTTCAKCGATAAAFICSEPGCPVNGGAAYPWTDPRRSAAASREPSDRVIPLARLDAIQGDDGPEAA